METVIRNVGELDTQDRSALERAVGHPLRETQRVILNVISIDIPPTESGPPKSLPDGVPPEWNVYEGLNDDEIEELTTAINQRCDLSRKFE